jgi:hypothetical protein
MQEQFFLLRVLADIRQSYITFEVSEKASNLHVDFDPISMYSLFSYMFKIIIYLILIIYFRILSRSLFNLYFICMSTEVCPVQDSFVSSANMEALVVCKQFER